MAVIGRRRWLQMTALAAAYGVSGFGLAKSSRAQVKARVVIVGAGFAGSACALHLRQLNPSIDVSLIDPAEHYATCPMSNEVLVGLRDMASITISRDGVRRAAVRLVPAKPSRKIVVSLFIVPPTSLASSACCPWNSEFR